ncbi:hypothetical protein DF135_24085 [Burkholderia cepacia]|nr:hypothetical protein DF135_24085 [Burkholderia cepacia]
MGGTRRAASVVQQSACRLPGALHLHVQGRTRSHRGPGRGTTRDRIEAGTRMRPAGPFDVAARPAAKISTG